MFVLQLWFLLVVFVVSCGKKVMGIIQNFLSSPFKPNIFFHSNSVLEIPFQGDDGTHRGFPQSQVSKPSELLLATLQLTPTSKAMKP